MGNRLAAKKQPAALEVKRASLKAALRDSLSHLSKSFRAVDSAYPGINSVEAVLVAVTEGCPRLSLCAQVAGLVKQRRQEEDSNDESEHHMVMSGDVDIFYSNDRESLEAKFFSLVQNSSTRLSLSLEKLIAFLQEEEGNSSNGTDSSDISNNSDTSNSINISSNSYINSSSSNINSSSCNNINIINSSNNISSSINNMNSSSRRSNSSSRELLRYLQLLRHGGRSQEDAGATMGEGIHEKGIQLEQHTIIIIHSGGGTKSPQSPGEENVKFLLLACLEECEGFLNQYRPRNDLYLGELNPNTERHGYGMVFYRNGSIYEGHWAKGKRHGEGRLEWPRGLSFEGSWQKDVPHGLGRFGFASGASYEAKWRRGWRRRGLGRFVSSNGVILEGYSDPLRELF